MTNDHKSGSLKRLLSWLINCDIGPFNHFAFEWNRFETGLKPDLWSCRIIPGLSHLELNLSSVIFLFTLLQNLTPYWKLKKKLYLLSNTKFALLEIGYHSKAVRATIAPPTYRDGCELINKFILEQFSAVGTIRHDTSFQQRLFWTASI